MATGLLTPVVEYLIQLLDKEARHVGGVKDEVNSLQRELSLISNWYPSDRMEHPISKEVIGQIMEKAYEAEDVIDTFILNTSKHRSRNPVGKIFHVLDHTKTLRDVATKIESLNKEINKIFANSTRYAGERDEASVDAESEETLHRHRREVEEDDVVGFNNNLMALKKLFRAKGDELDVISIIGMGGLGKTTLARKIYSTTHFALRAWVYVSQHDKTRELLVKILQEMPLPVKLRKNLEGMGEGELKEMLSKYLKGERYLVVMDDIWKTNFWDEVRSVFPNSSNGSRILITSRNKAVALKASSTPPYILPFLNKDESWKLFHKKVFRGGECCPELERVAKELAEGCCGLPLSIVVLGGILANEKQELLTWSKFSQVNRYLTQCKDILALSYTHLPRHLKPCFLYIGAYPKDFEIPVGQLINLWIAEGFIQHTDHNMDTQDVAEYYFEQLVDRSLIQVANRRTDRRSTKTCRVHDLLRDLCISQCAEEKFLEVRTEANHSSPNESRRLSIQGSIDSYISSKPSHPTINTRSLLFLGRDTNEFDQKHWTWVNENFKLIRVLNFGHVINLTIPKNIGRLIHLRYLGIKSDALKSIPPSICNLTNLETLDMRGTSLNRLPKGIWKLRRLRNLYMYGPVSFHDDLDPDDEPLWSLEVLSTVSLVPHNLQIFEAKLLRNLRKLGIWFADDSNSHVLNSLLSHLRHLRKLKIINYSDRSAVPISFAPNINKITLRQGWLEVGGSMKVLGKLSQLMILKLESCSLSSNFEFIAGSFPQLEVLKLKDLRIKEWKQERGAMPCLKHLVINRCIELTVLPSESLCALQDAEVLWSNKELVMTLQKMKKKKFLKNLRFNLVINPPLDAKFYQRTAVSPATSS